MIIILFLAFAARAESDFYLHQYRVPVDTSKTAQVSGLRGALFSEFSVADERQIRRDVEAELFRQLPAARNWLVPDVMLELEVRGHRPTVERQVERLWGQTTREFLGITIRGDAVFNLIVPNNSAIPFAVRPEDKIEALEMIVSRDHVRLAAIPLGARALARGDVAVIRGEGHPSRLHLSDDLRFRMHRALAGRRVSVGDFRVSLSLRLADEYPPLEIPLFDFTEADGVPGFNRTFWLNPTRFTKVSYLGKRCAELFAKIR